MGQKTNTTILRMGINNQEWKSKYKVSTTEESTLSAYKDLQFRTYIKQFLNKHGLFFHDYKTYFNSNTLYVFISYLVTKKSITLINKNLLKCNIKLKKNHIKHNLQKIKRKKIFSLIKQSHFLNHSKFQKRLWLIRKYKTYNQHNNYKNILEHQKNSFIQQFLEGFNQYNEKKHDIYLNLQPLNNRLSIPLTNTEQNVWKKKLLMLKRYSKFQIFKETINIILTAIKVKNSAQLIADFVAKQISQFKRQSYFFLFFKRVLNLFVNSPESKINGIKIVIKGRFNSAPRARKNTITAGKVPIQTISQNISYFQSTSFSLNGTFGVKVWICEKYLI